MYLEPLVKAQVTSLTIGYQDMRIQQTGIISDDPFVSLNDAYSRSNYTKERSLGCLMMGDDSLYPA